MKCILPVRVVCARLIEKRKADRWPIDLRSSFAWQGKVYAVKLTDISILGAGLHCRTAIPIGSLIKLRIPEKKSSILARVIHEAECEIDTLHVGVQFMGKPEDVVDKVGPLVQKAATQPSLNP